MTAKQTGTTTVVVLEPFQVSHEGVIHKPGERVDVPEHVARGWALYGWVEPAPEQTTERRKPPRRR